MGDVVQKPRIQRGDDRVLNDTQKAVAAIAEAVNQTPLRLPHLARFAVSSFDTSWVALGSTLLRIPVYHAREPGTLLSASFTIFDTIAASGVDFRQFYLERVRDGVYSTLMANVDTTQKGMAPNVPLELVLSTGPQDVQIAAGDVIALTIGGGGTFPAVTVGLFELYIEKAD